MSANRSKSQSVKKGIRKRKMNRVSGLTHRIAGNEQPSETKTQAYTADQASYFQFGRQVFHEYVLLQRCGSGAYGEVWLCQDATGRKLALKRILKDRMATEFKGIKALNKVPRHPNILLIHHIAEDPEYFWYTMDLADNVSAESGKYLADTLEYRIRKHLPLNIFAIIRDLIFALKAIHDAGLVHRDIKPGNILFLKGHAVLGDLGTMTQDTMEMSMAGTLGYLPPEVRSGTKSPGSMGKAGDAYALGKVLYCMISGNSPDAFPSYPRDLKANPQTGRLLQLVCRICDKNIARRLTDLKKIQQELNAIMSMGDKPLSSLEKIAGHRKMMIGMLCFIVLAGGIVYAGYRLHKKRTPKEKPVSTSQHQNATTPVRNETITFLLPGNVKLEMVRIPAGSFMMGSPEGEFHRFPSRENRHKVTLTQDYWMARYEITQQQYVSVMGNNPSKFRGEKLPVEQVSWSNAAAFCKKLNEVCRGELPAGYQFDLPTEAEWEYACRATTTTCLNNGKDFFSDQASRDMDEIAWYNNNSGMTTHEVGLKKPNLWGLYDMHGNVSEWCCEWSEQYDGDQVDPITKNDRPKSLRSGAYFNEPRHIRQAFRHPVSNPQILFSKTQCDDSGNNGIRLVLVPLRKSSPAK